MAIEKGDQKCYYSSLLIQKPVHDAGDKANAAEGAAPAVCGVAEPMTGNRPPRIKSKLSSISNSTFGEREHENMLSAFNIIIITLPCIYLIVVSTGVRPSDPVQKRKARKPPEGNSRKLKAMMTILQSQRA